LVEIWQLDRAVSSCSQGPINPDPGLNLIKLHMCTLQQLHNKRLILLLRSVHAIASHSNGQFR